MNGPIVNPNPALPVPKPAAAGADARESAAQAWQREMERAQMEAWLAHAVIGSHGPKPAMPGWAPLPAAAHAVPSGTAAMASAARASAVGAVGFAAEASALSDHQVAPSSRRASAPATARGEAAESVSAQSPAPASPRADMRVMEAAASSASAGKSQVVPGAEATAQLVAALEGVGPIVATTTTSGQIAAQATESRGAPGQPVAQTIALIKPEGLSPTSQAATVPAAVTAASPLAALTGAGAFPSDRERPASISMDPVQHGVPGRSAASPKEPVRLHADWSAEGVRLWLGMDADVAGTLPSITLQLQRWLSAQGVRLLSISCNGRAVLEEHEPAATDIYQADTHRGEFMPLPYPHPYQKESS